MASSEATFTKESVVPSSEKNQAFKDTSSVPSKLGTTPDEDFSWPDCGSATAEPKFNPDERALPDEKKSQGKINLEITIGLGLPGIVLKFTDKGNR